MSALPHFTLPLDDAGRLIPAFASLADERVFLAWRVGPRRRNGKLSKPPVVSGTEDQNGWTNAGKTLAEAIEHARQSRLAGIGIVMGSRARALGLTGIDLDDALNDDGLAAEWAREILVQDGLIPTYCEMSPSKRGFRMLAFGEGSKAGKDAEVYDGRSTQFLTLTGRRLQKSPLDIRPAAAAIKGALARAEAVPSIETMERREAAEAAEALKKADAAAVALAANQGAASPAAGATAPVAGEPGDDASGDTAAPLTSARTSDRVTDLSDEAFAAALDMVPCSSLSRDQWRTVMLGLHHQFGGSHEGFTLFDTWARVDAARYKPEECQKQWEDAGRPREGQNPVTIRALMSFAKERGWKPPKGAPAADGEPAGGDGEWPAPMSLESLQSDLPPGRWLPGTLPTAFERFGRDLAARIGADPEAMLGMMLPVLGALTPGAVSFAPRGDSRWRVPVLFFAALVGKPGSMKTPIISGLTDPLEKAEAAWRREYKRAETQHAREVARLKAEKSTELPPPKPKQRRRSTTSATTEGHARLIEKTGEAIITLADELTTFFGSFDKYSGTGSTGGTDRAYWLSGYDGKAHHFDRTDEAKCISVDSVRASVIGGTQPRVLASVLASLTSDGLAARFLYVPTGTPRMSVDMAADESRAALYALACRIILDMARADLGVEIVLRADDNAKAVSFEAEQFGIASQGGLPEDDPLRDIAAKARGFVARIAAALHIVEWALAQATELQLGLQEKPEPIALAVTGATAAKALAIWKAFYWPSAMRTYTGAARITTDRDVRDLKDFVEGLAPDKATFTASDVRGVKNRFRGEGAAALKAAAVVLEMANWLRRAEKSGGTVWTVNPALRRSR